MEVLFICMANMGRSQIAEAFFNALAEKHSASSAGIAARAEPVPQPVVSCMKDAGIDVSDGTGKQVTRDMVQDAGMVVVVLQEHERAKVPDYIKNSGKTEYWAVPEGKGTPYDFLCKIRDDIRKRVEKLVCGMEG
jgi:arsenate reductase (thioredoxin)